MSQICISQFCREMLRQPVSFKFNSSPISLVSFSNFLELASICTILNSPLVYLKEVSTFSLKFYFERGFLRAGYSHKLTVTMSCNDVLSSSAFFHRFFLLRIFYGNLFCEQTMRCSQHHLFLGLSSFLKEVILTLNQRSLSPGLSATY